MLLKSVRDYSKRGDALPVPNLIEVQLAAYERFIQLQKPPDRAGSGDGVGISSARGVPHRQL